MNFSYNTPVEGDGGGEEDNKASFPGGLLDMDFPSGTVNNPGTAFATQHMGQGGQFHMQPYAGSSMQQQSMGNQMGGMQTQQETHDTNGDEEQTQAKAAQGLVGMSTNRSNPAQHTYGGVHANGSNLDWSNLMYSPSMFTGSPVVGAQATGVAGNPDQMGEQQQQTQASAGAWGSMSDATAQYQHHQGYPQGFRMQQQAFSQPRGRPHSMGDIRTAGLNNLSYTDPRSAQPLGINFNTLRGAPRFPSYGSDDSFGPNGYRPQPGGFESPDHKAANLNQVPMAQEASANGRARQPFAVPPSARTLQSQAHAQGAGSQDFKSHPSTPTFYNPNTNYQGYSGGLPGTPNGTMTSAASYGGFGTQHQGGHGHPQQPQYFQTLQRHGALSGKRQAPQDDDQDDENSSASESDASESPPPNSQPARKRRKSKHEQDDEDDYHPPGTGSRPANSMIRSLARSSDGEDYKPPKSGTGKSKKRTSSHAVQRKSTNSSSSNPTSPATRVPRRTSATPKRPARKRQSGSALPRVNLTEEQRRDNHIKSEKNRRDLIKNNYEEIRNLVPALKGGKSGLSKAEELNEIVEFIENLLAGNLYMLDMLKTWDPEGSERDGKFEYESSDDEGAGAAGGLNMELHAY